MGEFYRHIVIAKVEKIVSAYFNAQKINKNGKQ